MTWLSTPESAGHLSEAVSHFNEALDLLERDGTELDATRCLSDALNEIQTAWSRFGAGKPTGAVESFQAMLTQELRPEARTELLSSDAALDLLGLDARIPEPAVIPVQLLLLNLLLDRPDERLVIYGSLAPGKPNHDVIGDLSGEYRDCAVHGRVSEVDGFPCFTWEPSEASFAALLFSSKQLPGKWDALDRFEGAAYKRRLIPATISSGLSIASIYLSTAADRPTSGER